MVSFVVVSKNKESGFAYITTQCDLLHISPFDQTILRVEPLEKTLTKASLGIAAIKTIQKKIYLKPLQGNNKAVIIHDGEALTDEAQNALLKVLEEPPHSTYIFILTNTLYALLPTILSRCQIIHIDQREEKTNEALTTVLSQLPSLSVGNKLFLAEKQSKQKQATIDWLEQLQSEVRNLLLTLVKEDREAPIQFYTHLAKNIQNTHTVIQETNVNLRLALEHLFLNL